MSAGVNTCAILAVIQLAADSIWADAAKNKDYIANVEAIRAIRENQSVRIVELENPQKDRQVSLYWPEDCDETTSACSDDCTTNGARPGTHCQDYKLNMCREVEFSIEEKEFRSLATSFEEAVAISLLRKMKSLDEWIAKQAVIKLESGKGVNSYNGGKGSVSGFETEVQSGYWNASLFGYLHLVSQFNKFNSPYLLSGTGLYEAAWNANMNSGNADGKGTASMFSSMKTYFDIFNVDSQLTPDIAMFLVNRNALAFHSKTYYNWNAGDMKADQWGGPGSSAGYRYQVASKNLPGVNYDVIYKIACSGNKIIHNWKIQFNGDIFRNPVGCNPNNTNILKFVCS